MHITMNSRCNVKTLQCEDIVVMWDQYETKMTEKNPTKFRKCLLDFPQCQMSKTFIGGAIFREFESEAPVAEEMLDRVVCSREQFSFQMCLEGGDASGIFHNWRQRVPDSCWCRNAECLRLKVDPCRRLIEYSSWQEDLRVRAAVDDNEASHVDKPAVLFSEFYMW